MRVAIIGQTGQLARALLRECAANGINATPHGRNALNLESSSDIIERYTLGLEADVVVIAAAYTAVDKAEEETTVAFAVNAEAPAAIARACAKTDKALVHISTDYVFQGRAKAPYKIEDATDPVNTYGRSKLAGEMAVLETHERAAVLRTSWVYDGTGKNFMTTMLRLGQTREQINVVSDQIGRPTYAGHLAKASLTIAQALLSDKSKATSGLYHVTDSGTQISWADFAAEIFETAQNALGRHVRVEPIATSAYPTPAKRPAFSVLDLSRFELRFGALPHWREGLELSLIEWATHKN